MILSASRRTDLPAFYFPWLLRRLQEGFLLVRNPMNPRQVSRVDLSPRLIDGIVFWTKNPLPMLPHLDALGDYPCYFQFTITPYGPEIEPGLPDKRKEIIPAFQELSRRIGPRRMIWRYDPIFLSPAYTWEFHLARFREYARLLAPYARECTISFLDYYKCMRKTAGRLDMERPSPERQAAFAEELASIARESGLRLTACAEALSLAPYGVEPARCVNSEIFSELLGVSLPVPKAKGQRPNCGCAESVDIGAYSSCPNGCLYCYANHSSSAASPGHDPDSPLLLGRLRPEDQVIPRQARSYASPQQRLF